MGVRLDSADVPAGRGAIGSSACDSLHPVSDTRSNAAPPANAPPVVELLDAAIAGSNGETTPVLEAVTWAVGPGSFWVVGGLPGAGKSQLLQTAAGLLRPLRGTHRLFGSDLTALAGPARDALRRRVGFVFAEGARLFGHLSVLQNIALPLCYHGDCGFEAVADQVQALLQAGELEGFARWLPGRLNQAWRRRVALVRALALEPEVLFLDDPLAGLDPRHTAWWIGLLTRLATAPPPGSPPPLPFRRSAGEHPLTLVVATDQLGPWVGLGRQFALLAGQRWQGVGGRAEVTTAADPRVRELLAPPPAAT